MLSRLPRASASALRQSRSFAARRIVRPTPGAGMIVYTSGSTGRPERGAAQDRADRLAGTRSRRGNRASPADLNLSLLPFRVAARDHHRHLRAGLDRRAHAFRFGCRRERRSRQAGRSSWCVRGAAADDSRARPATAPVSSHNSKRENFARPRACASSRSAARASQTL